MNEKDYKLSPEDRKLLLKDLCARLADGVEVFYNTTIPISTLKTINSEKGTCIVYDHSEWYRHTKLPIEEIKPYLRPMSSMTEEEAMKVAELWGLKDILSISVKENYISVELDDGVAGSETYTIWFKEIVSSIELFDWLNEHHFDYRGLIEKGLALKAKE